MNDPPTDRTTPHAGQKEKTAGADRKRAPQPRPEGAGSPASTPHGPRQDQVRTMESEDQGQPPAADFKPEELDDPMADHPDRKPGRDHPGQRPLTDNKAGG